MSYEKNGVEYPSVTTVLNELHKPALVQWSANCAVDYIRDKIIFLKDDNPHVVDKILTLARLAYKDVSEKAKDIGTQVHDHIENYIKKGIDPRGEMSPEVENGFLAFLEWEKLNHVEWLRSECTVICETHGYGGTYDADAMINGELYRIDFKTSKSIYPEYRKQLAAYKKADGSDARIAVLRLDKETGEPEFKDITKGYEKHYIAFLKLLDFYYADKKRRLKNNPFVEFYHG